MSLPTPSTFSQENPRPRTRSTRMPELSVDRHLLSSVAAAFLATGVVYLTIPGVGLVLFGERGRGLLALAGAALCGWWTYALVRRIGWEQMTR